MKYKDIMRALKIWAKRQTKDLKTISAILIVGVNVNNDNFVEKTNKY